MAYRRENSLTDGATEQRLDDRGVAVASEPKRRCFVAVFVGSFTSTPFVISAVTSSARPYRAASVSGVALAHFTTKSAMRPKHRPAAAVRERSAFQPTATVA